MLTNPFVQPRNTRSSVLLALLLGAALLSASTASRASVTSEWSATATRKESFSRILIVGISPDLNQRCAFERALAAKIKSETTVAIVSCDAMGLNDPLTRENVEAVVAAKNADAVLATSLISKTWDVQEGGTFDTRGGAYYKPTDSYFGVYGTVVDVDFQTTESITTIKGEAHITSRLYETRGATLVYTLDTKVKNIESRGEGLAAITPPIGKRLRKDGLIR